MSDTAAPRIDTGPANMWRTLHLILTPAPGRLHNTLMLVAGVLVTLVIWETFRIPGIALACYVILFVSHDERTTTIVSALTAALAATVAVFGAILINMVGLSEPALRIMLMAGATFVAMFLYRASKPGPALFAAGFIIVYALTESDQLLSISLSSATVTNSSGRGTGTPEIAFVPPDEALVHTLLWLSAMVAVPAFVIAGINSLFGRDPAVLLKDGLRLRLETAEAWCGGRPGALRRLEAVAPHGSTELLKLAGLAEKAHGPDAEPPEANKAMILAASRLLLACLAAERMQATATRPGWMASAARRCAALRQGKDDPAGNGADDDQIGAEVQRALDEFARGRHAKSASHAPKGKKEKGGFWKDDAFSAVNVQFALKVTLSVMTCYVINNALNWQGIGTSVVTCFFVSLGSLGESGHKMTLRIAGCLVGAAMGIGAIILLMPAMTDLLDLLLLVAPATFVAAWVACGSERISYAGWQLALAFYETVLQGSGPVVDMEPAKDRIIGILLGNVVCYVVLATIWPVHVDKLTAGSIAEALAALARLLRLRDGGDHRHEADTTREQFAQAVGKARSLMQDKLYEGTRPGDISLGEQLAEQVQALIVPVAMLAADRGDDGQQSGGKEKLAAWLDEVASLFRRGQVRREAFPAPPASPEVDSRSHLAWALMEQELHALPLGFEAARRRDCPPGIAGPRR